MLKQRTSKKLVLGLSFFLAVFLFNFTGFDKNIAQAENFSEYPYEEYPDELYVYGDAVWDKNTAGLVFNKPVTIVEGATLTIEKGTVVKFERNPDEFNDPSGIFVLDGKLVVNGTREEKVKFTSDEDYSGFVLDFYDQGETQENRTSYLRHAEISKGGYEIGDGDEPPLTFLKNFFIKAAYAFGHEYGAVRIEAGNVHIENSIFTDNLYADVQVLNGIKYKYDEEGMNPPEVDGEFEPSVEIVNSNLLDERAVVSELKCRKINEETGESYLDGICRDKTYLKNNWYGSEEGPANRVSGYHKLDSYRENALIVDPVIVIPGIMGSFPSAPLGGKLVLDPILQTYSNLMASLAANGYQKNINLFDFPYEWRDGNILTADILKQKIQAVKSSAKISKVDLVAHSMGGLVARYYIESPIYQNDMDQLVTLGTPHKGSPESYLYWEAGESGVKLEDKVAKQLFRIEAAHSGFSDLKEYIQTRITSVRDLLPDYDYLRNASDGEMKAYPDDYPENTFLDFLNDEDRVSNLGKVNFYNIYGKVSGSSTISKFKVVASTKAGMWEHGMPKDFYNKETDRGIEYESGDETVPLASAKGIESDDEEEIDSSHSDLPTTAQCYVIAKLTGVDRNDCQYISTFKRIKKILTFGVFSPVDIQIISPSGKWAGKNIKNLPEGDKIENAYYTGYSGIANEFLSIPDPEDGGYIVVTEGTAEGSYKIEMAKISEEDGSGQAIETEKVLEGTASSGLISEETINTESETALSPAEKAAAMIANVKYYRQLGLIKNRESEKNLEKNLKQLKWWLDFKNQSLERWKNDARRQKLLKKEFDKYVEREIRGIESFLSKFGRRYLDQKAVDLIKEDLEWIRGESASGS